MMKRIHGTKKILFLVFNVFILLFISCGIEDYLFLYPVPSGNITRELVSEATIRLPYFDLNEYYYFTNFVIYYRIYISGAELASINEGDLSGLNPTLYSDYNAFLPYTNSETNISTSIGSLFKNRNYHVLAVEGADIEKDILSDNALGKTIILDFIQTPGTIPMLRVDGIASPYSLYRSNGDGLFSPLPVNRYFLNSSELNASENASSTINADVANMNVSGPRFTYVSMYIVVAGIDSNFSPIYSAPTFIGILRLPDAN